MFKLLIFSIFDKAISYQEKIMSKNNDANRKKNKKKIDQKKRKIQNAEAERKARLKQIREDFNAREADNEL
ncbi:hypothetical protein EG347_17940 [Chryseobacterium sp. G0186]|nr:hypothetical protein EG347_17940 [Chryseobacterium sp. G0186]